MTKDTRFKILFCIRQGGIGGGESHLIDLVEFLNKELFKPLVLAFTDGAMITHFKRQGISTFVIPTERPFDISVTSAVNGLLEKEKPDLAHVIGTRAFSNLFMALRNKKLPVVYTIQGWSFHAGQNILRKFLGIQSERLLTKRANVNINVSYGNQETGKEAIKNFQSVVVRNGVNLNVFNKDKSWPDIRKELGIPKDVFLVGFIARMTLQKDPLNMIRAFAHFSKQQPGVHLLMVGDGELKAEAQALARQLDISDRVTFEAFRKDVPALLNCIDVFCLPSLWEGLSIALLEAMAMGKPIVATGVDGTREILNDGENGLLIAPNDPTQLSEKLTLLKQNAALRKKLSENAFRTITEEFNAAKMTADVEQIYLKLLPKMEQRAKAPLHQYV